MPESYTYLIGSLLTFVFFIFLYLRRKDVREEMLFSGIIFIFPAIFVQAFFWTRDWWRIPTITGTRIGIEDILFTISVAGACSACYEVLFKKRVSIRKGRHALDIFRKREFWISTLFFLVTFTIAHYFLGLTSFWAWVVVTIILALALWLLRRDLIVDSLASGAIYAAFSIPVFFLLNLLEPGFVQKYWFLEKLSGIIFLGVPLEDLIWFFTIGLLIGPVYEFWQEGTLKDYPGKVGTKSARP
ncbi:MAG: lycopene cyclase domain-containing protein [archaeon]